MKLNESPKKKKKRSVAQQQRDLQKLAVTPADRPPVALGKLYWRVGAVLAVAWVLAVGTGTWLHRLWPVGAAGALTVVTAGLGVWLIRTMKKTEALGALLRGAADSKESRQAALDTLGKDYKKGDAQAAMARAQLELQEDPRKALATLESIDLGKIYNPGLADQIRAMRATIHLQLGELAEASLLADALDLGKQQEPKTRAMFATVAAETWARTGHGTKAIATLELFNPDAEENAEMRVQMWRARAFAAAATSDLKGIERAIRKLADTNPQLLGMFVGQKKVHPLLERTAKQALMRSGAVPRKMVRQRM